MAASSAASSLNLDMFGVKTANSKRIMWKTAEHITTHYSTKKTSCWQSNKFGGTCTNSDRGVSHCQGLDDRWSKYIGVSREGAESMVKKVRARSTTSVVDTDRGGN